MSKPVTMAAMWAHQAHGDLATAARAAASVSMQIARELGEGAPLDATSLLLADGEIEAAWKATTEALKNIARAREALVTAREQLEP